MAATHYLSHFLTLSLVVNCANSKVVWSLTQQLIR